MADQLIVCNRSGVPYAELESAVVDHMTWTLDPFSNPGALNFALPTRDPKWAEVKLWAREIQWWRDGACYWWGVPVRRQSDKTTARISCLSLEEYFRSKRFFGPTPSLPGFGWPKTTAAGGASVFGDFGLSLTGWTATGCTPTSVSDTAAEGAYSFQLVATTSADNYLEFTFDVTNGGAGVASGYLIYYLKGWFRLESLTAPAWQERGLYGQCQYPIGTLYDEQWAPITANAPTAAATAGPGSTGWFRLETAVKVPTGPSAITSRIKTRLYAPQGTIKWDAVNWFLTRSVGSNGGEIIDNRYIIERVFEYGAGSTAAHQALGKSDLNIGHSIPSCGVTSQRAYGLADNGSVGAALSEMALLGYYDLAIGYNSAGTTRTLNGWTPRRGTLASTFPLTIDENGTGNISNFSFDEDGTKTANRLRMLGRGDGPDREVYECVDDSVLGVGLESVETGPADSPLNTLYRKAQERLRITQYAVKLPAIEVKVGQGNIYLGSLNPGDTVPVVINYGGIAYTDVNRIATVELKPGPDTLAYTFNDQ